jgi:polyhydroxyalkanoate synthesis regulator phasin
MASRKRTRKTTPRRKTAPRRASARKSGDVLRDTWEAALATLASAEQAVEKEIRQLLKKNKIDAKDASGVLREITRRVSKERKRVLKQIDAQAQALQARIHKERRSLQKMVDDAVHGTLAAFNIPSRKEVAELTRKVNQLSKKIDSIRRR